MRILVKFYYLVFIKTRSWLRFINADGWENWRALVFFLGFQFVAIFQIFVWMDVLYERPMFASEYEIVYIVLLGMLLTVVNYFAILHKKKWEFYQRLFDSYSPQKNRLLSWVVVLFGVVVSGSLILAFYKMSKIDWSAYRWKG